MKSEKKCNAIVFGLTANHIFAVACVMMDLKRLTSSLIDEVVILHDGIHPQDQKILEAILPTRFILYDFPLMSDRVRYSRSVQYFTKMVFTKFECLRLLDSYKNIVWMDYDIVIQSDISELFSPCDTGIKIMRGGVSVREQLLEPVAEYEMNTEGISTGLFVFHDNLKNYMEMYRFCYEKLESYAPILYMPDQAIFDFMIQEFEVQAELLEGGVYATHPTNLDNVAQAKIIHSWGQPKFWNGMHNAQWQANYNAWLQMGGSRYKPLTTIDKALSKAKKILYRIRLFLMSI
jgi:lipopolysaccharide biosynthesis glycosyltransferase